MPTGMSLVELLITLAIVAVLISLAVPSYQRQQLLAYRMEGQNQLLQYAIAQSEFRLQHRSFATMEQLAMSSSARYEFAVIEASNNKFSLSATALGQQSADSGCEVMTIDQSMLGLPASCW